MKVSRSVAGLVAAGVTAVLVFASAAPAQAATVDWNACSGSLAALVQEGSSVTVTLPEGCVVLGTDFIDSNWVDNGDGTYTWTSSTPTDAVIMSTTGAGDGVNVAYTCGWAEIVPDFVTQLENLGFTVLDLCSSNVPPRPTFLQSVGVPPSGSCADVVDGDFGFGKRFSGGWSKSWAEWANGGQGGDVCVRTIAWDSSVQDWGAIAS